MNNGKVIGQDILIAELTHPSNLSQIAMKEGTQAASKKINQDLEVLQSYAKAGWKITPDPGSENEFAEGKSYSYGRTEIGNEYYDFGTPENRMVSVSSAERISPNVVIFGSREASSYFSSKEMEAKLEALSKAAPAQTFSSEENFVARPRSQKLRYLFDPGPGEKFAKLMKPDWKALDVYKPKSGQSFKENGIDAFDIKTHPEIADFGHYRGTFQTPRILILADPDGFDDMVTSRALTGTRGQFLQGLMDDLGVSDQYLVIKTVPFGMDGATNEEWERTLERTRKYRDLLINEILSDNPKLELIITDGAYAKTEIERILKSRTNSKSTPVVSIARSIKNEGNFGIAEAESSIRKISGFEKVKVSGKMANIPRTHLTFYARLWEGTSGDRVLNAGGQKFKGQVFAVVVPSWCTQQKRTLDASTSKDVDALQKRLVKGGLRLPGEKVPDFLKRIHP